MRLVELPVDEIVARYKAGESTCVLGLAYGVNYETVRNRLRAAGVLMREGRWSRRAGGPLCANSYGYLLTRDRDGRQCLVHRARWEARYGHIPEAHDIHHKNSQKTDNDIANLQCLPHREHARLHGEQGA